MSKNTTALSTVRMFDGAKWDTYKRDGKKHRAAEARRAAWEATRPSKAERAAQVAERKESNTYLAAGMRAAELVPSGSAWTAFKAGERDTRVLAAMNAADGLVFRKPVDRKASTKASAKAGKGKGAKAAKVVTEVVTATKPEEGTKAARKTAKRRSKAARKAYQTRLANGTAVRVNGRFVKAGEVAQIAATVALDETFEAFAGPLRSVGLSESQIKAAFACK